MPRLSVVAMPHALCSTPSCTKRRFHNFCHSSEERLGKRGRSEPHANVLHVTQPGNAFQHGIGFVRLCMVEQEGTQLDLPPDLHPSGRFTTRFTATVKGMAPDNRNAAHVFDAEGVCFSLRARDMVRSDAVAHWKPLTETLGARHKSSLAAKTHAAVARRMAMFVSVLRETYTTDSTQLVFSLDGIGRNREVFGQEFADTGADQTPVFRTFEIEPDVALSQQLLYGREAVVYTGAQFQERFGYGACGSRDTAPPGIEYLITNRHNSKGVSNSLVSQQDCGRLVALNLDYCGGIYGGLDWDGSQRTLSNLLARCPRLVVLMLTLSKRQRAGLKYDFERYARTPHGFRVVHTFDSPQDNAGVLTRLFVRVFDIPRTIRVPGKMWHWCGAKSATVGGRLRDFECVIKHIEATTRVHVLYSIDDDTDDQAMPNLSFETLRTWACWDPCARIGSAGSVALHLEEERLCALRKTLEDDLRDSIRAIDCELARLRGGTGSPTMTATDPVYRSRRTHSASREAYGRPHMPSVL